MLVFFFYEPFPKANFFTFPLILTFNIFEGRDNLFKKRIATLLEAEEDLGGAQNIVAYCTINNLPINDRTLLRHFCPHLLQTNENENMASAIFAKIEKKTEPKFITKAGVELSELKWEDQDQIWGAFENIHTASDFWQSLDKFPKNTSALKSVITRAFLKLRDSDSELEALKEFLQDRSEWKTKTKICGTHTTTVTCEYKDKDFCQGNSLSHHFGLAVLFSMCLPGLVHGLANLIFYQVGLFDFHTSYISQLNFSGHRVPAGIWSRD